MPYLQQSIKVGDHCHFTGVYRDAAHNSCNLQRRKPLILPVILHNIHGYDAHLFIKQFAVCQANLIAYLQQKRNIFHFLRRLKLMSMSRRTGETVSLNFEIRFIDSYKFLQKSLANVVGNLQPDDFKKTQRLYSKKT